MSDPRLQYAALPYRPAGADVEILLVTSLGTKRWIIPKGWPIKDHAPHEAAAREAVEEAGVEGEVARDAIGTYRYEKRRKSGAVLPCIVDVFPLRVTGQRKHWHEQGRRKLTWLSPEKAAGMVSDTDLGEIILGWAARLRGSAAGEPGGLSGAAASAPRPNPASSSRTGR